MTQFTEEDIKLASGLLKKGQVIAFPTDTIYALACDAKNDAAIQQLFELKARDLSKAMAVLTDSINRIASFTTLSTRNHAILERTLPGPYSFILPYNGTQISNLIIDKTTKTIGVRIPGDQFCLSMLREFDSPIVATSANISGNKHAISAEEVHKFFGPRVSAIFGTTCPLNSPSTIIDLSQNKIRFLREGVISKQDFLNIIKDLL